MNRMLRIGIKLEKILDSLEDPDSLNDLELEWQDINKRIINFEKKLDEINKLKKVYNIN